jgi:para-aminobenzoate synthetase component I
MKKAKIIEFKSNLDSMELFEAVKKDGNYPFFLDSGMDEKK